jgi:hypothetical protein
MHQQIPRQHNRREAKTQQKQHSHDYGNPSALRRRQPTKPYPRATLPSSRRNIYILKIVSEIIAQISMQRSPRRHRTSARRHRL